MNLKKLEETTHLITKGSSNPLKVKVNNNEFYKKRQIKIERRRRQRRYYTYIQNTRITSGCKEVPR